MTTDVYRRGPFIFTLHVETLDADIATPSCDSIGGGMLAIWRALDKKPKVFESVGTCRRMGVPTFSLVEKPSELRQPNPGDAAAAGQARSEPDAI